MQSKIVAIYSANRNHYSLLEVILKSLRILDCKVMLFLAEGMQQDIYPTANILIQQTVSNKRFVSSEIFKKMNSADFIIVDQLYSFRELLSFRIHKLTRPNLMLIHDCNTWFLPKAPKKLVDKVKNVLTQYTRKRIGHFAVAGENMLEHCVSDLGIKNVSLIPFRYADFNPNLDISPKGYQKGTPIRLVVPGMITNRRNYHRLLEVVANEKLKEKVDLVLLGRPEGLYGKEILSKASALVERGYHITYWYDFISNEEFEKEVRLAHVLFSFFNPVFITNNGQNETYGISKETGIALLMYNKAKVGILPVVFNQMKTIKNQTITYESIEELDIILQSIYNGTLDLQTKTSKAVENALAMDINIIVQRINSAYQSQIKGK